MSDEGL